MKPCYYLTLLSALLSLGLPSCSHQEGYPLGTRPADSRPIHLSVYAPREATLRAMGQDASDPLRAINHLRLAFYSSGESAVVKELREVEVTSQTNLSDIVVALPEGAYQLVVLANPTIRLKELTSIGSPLTQLTTPQTLTTGNLLSRKPSFTVSLLNAGGAIAISPEAFGGQAQAVQVKLEPTLARVLLYGEPTLAAGATKGAGEAAYVIQPQAKQVAPLRPLGLLLSGGRETAQTRASGEESYPLGALFTLWEKQKPTDLSQGLGYFVRDELTSSAGSSYWVSIASQEKDLASLYTQGGIYARETTIPTTAYLTGAVPSVLIRYPYIPAGLSLSSGEGWLSYAGKYYAESQVKAWIQRGSFPDEGLQQALHRGAITAASFAAPFSKEGVDFFYQGYSYYTYPIRHYGDSQAPEKTSPGRYGLVRGNEYRIHLTRILRPGHPLPPEMAKDLSPLTEEKDLRATLEILPLKVRSSEAHL